MAAVVPPSGFQTVQQLRAALRNGAIETFDGIIAAVKIDGNDIGDGLPRDVASKITYSVLLTDPGVSIPPASLEDLVPASRAASNVRVIGPRRLTPCKVHVVTVNGNATVMFYPWTPERDDLYDCNNTPILEVT